jgi:hypothetical protein
MSNNVGQWDGGTVGRIMRRLAFTVPLSLCPTVPLLAQVGHDPSHSPFRDINTHQQVAFVVGTFSGNRGVGGVGAQRGTLFGIRIRNRLSGPLDLEIGGSYIASKRLVIDPTKPDSIRRSGPIDYGLLEGDLGVTLTLTGAKTWHGLAPYVGFGFGVMAPTSTRTDPGGYRAAINFTFVPRIGTTLSVGRTLSLLFEARDNTIRYEWPLLYFDPRDANNKPLPPPVIAAGGRDRQLTHNLTLSAGVAYHFTF